MKILSAQQIRDADAFTIKNEPISSLDLMERAALKCADWICNRFDRLQSFDIVCGPGNNGGDGLAIARILKRRGRQVKVSLLPSETRSEDNEANLKRLNEVGVEPTQLGDSVNSESFTSDILIDCLFGTGINKPLQGLAGDVVEAMNRSGRPVISIDMPSGLNPDDNRNMKYGKVISAAITLTFQYPKLSFLLPDRGKYTRDWEVIDIGLSPEYTATVNTDKYFVTEEDILEIYRAPEKFSHKGSNGHLLLIAGSKGKIGAAVLAAKAALRAGSGLVTVLVPECGYTVVQTAVPEAMVMTAGTDFIDDLPDLTPFTCIACGPGIGQHAETADMLKKLIKTAEVPLILDADALNILSENKTWLSFLPPGSVLTPHPGEMARLTGKYEDDETRLEVQKEFSLKHQVIICRKGAYTCTSFPDGNMFFNSTGNPAMATGGTGDVLTGIIGGLTARGYNSHLASVAGVYLHGKAGDLVLEQSGRQSLIAGDIVDAFKWK